MKKADAGVESPFMFDAFECLDIEPTFDLDLTVLDQKYFARQVMTHPDQVAQKKEQAALHSAEINRAYHLLKNPLTRAECLLQLKKIPLPGVDGQTVQDTGFLTEAMELREQLEESNTPEQLQHLELKIQASFQDHCSLFSRTLSGDDQLSLQYLYLRMTYLSKALSDLKALKHRTLF